MMQIDTLNRFFPFNMMSRELLNALEEGVRVEEYQDDDYVYRLGEELTDLCYVLEGTVQIMDMGERANQVIKHDSKSALLPFTHEVPDGAVAIAKTGSKVLKVDYQLLDRLLPAEQQEIRTQIKPGRKVQPVEPEPVAEDTEPEYLEMPEDVSDSIQLINSQAQSMQDTAPEAARSGKAPAGSARRKPGGKTGKQLAAEKPVAADKKEATGKKSAAQKELAAQKKVTAQKKLAAEKKVAAQKKLAAEKKVAAQKKLSAEKKVAAQKKTSAEAGRQPERKAAGEFKTNKKRKTVADMMLELKDFLNSEIRLEADPKLSGARQFLYSEIRLEPKARKPVPVEKPAAEYKAVRPEQAAADQAAEERPPQAQMSEADYRELETQEYLRAVTLFRQQKWESAHAAFKALYSANPRTNLYRTYVNRCEEQVNRAAQP